MKQNYPCVVQRDWLGLVVQDIALNHERLMVCLCDSVTCMLKFDISFVCKSSDISDMGNMYMCVGMLCMCIKKCTAKVCSVTVVLQ